MKLGITIIFLIPFMLFSCQSDSGTKNDGSPQATMENWLKGLEEENFSALKKISMGNTLAYVSDMESFFEGVANDTPNGKTETKKISCSEITEHKVKCEYCCNQGDKEIFILTREQEQWKVSDIYADLQQFDKKNLKEEEKLNSYLNSKLSK